MNFSFAEDTCLIARLPACILKKKKITLQLNHIQSDSLPTCVTHFPPLPLFTQLSAVISIPLWQWFLQRFGKKTAAFCGITVSTLFLFWFANTDGYTLMFVPSCGQSHECSVPVWNNRSTLEKCCFKKTFCFVSLSTRSSGSCRSPWCWSSSPTWWWPTSWLSPLGSAWLLRSCCRGKTMRGSITSWSLSLFSCQNFYIFAKDDKKTNTSNVLDPSRIHTSWSLSKSRCSYLKICREDNYFLPPFPSHVRFQLHQINY